MRFAFVIFTILAIPVLAHAATLKVPSQFPTIQDAIDAAVNGDIVLVAPGTYVEKINFIGKAITVKSEQGASVTAIDGNESYSVVICLSGEGNDSVLDGFTITNAESQVGGGMYNFLSSPTVTHCIFEDNLAYDVYPSAGLGGGIYNMKSSPVVTHCTFSGNTAFCGGGICNWENSSPVVTHCTFILNTAAHGGGMYNRNYSSPTVAHCTFILNTAGDGGGMYNCNNGNPTVSDCIFSENKGLNDGGGIFAWDGCSPTVTDCVFTANIAENNGGGIRFTNCSPTVIRCTFTANTAFIGGGMFIYYNCDPTVTNCILSANTALKFGGGMHIESNSSPTVTNCTFFKNNALDEGGGMEINYNGNPTIANTILWKNDAPEGPEIWIGKTSKPSTVNISYSNVKGGQASVYVDPGCSLNWGSSMIDSDPLFIDPANGDYHLTYHSPCRNTGNNSAVTELTDFEGDPRIAYGTVDMGADEFYTHLYWTGDATPGGAIELKLVGLPGTTPVGLCIGTGVLDPPLKSMWGDWYLQFPIIGPLDLGKIPSPDGVLIIPGAIPGSPPPPYSIPMQALIGVELTNLSVLEIE